MRIVLKNFGPIETAEISLSKDFTVILGPNNIGKSYCASIAYLILKTLCDMQSKLSRPYFSYAVRESLDFTKIQQALINVPKNEWLDVSEQICKTIDVFINQTIGEQLQSSLIATYGSLASIRNSEIHPPTIEIEFESTAIAIEVHDDGITIASSSLKKINIRKMSVNKAEKFEPEAVWLCAKSTDKSVSMKQVSIHATRMIEEIYRLSISGISSVYFLPASRSGLYQSLNAFSQILAELSKKRSFFSQQFKIPSIPEPVSDYFMKLSEIGATENTSEGPYEDIASYIEREILKGDIKYEFNEKHIYYSPQNSDTSTSLDIAYASSMVSEISPIVAYLRYVIDPIQNVRKIPFSSGSPAKPIIFIEEPEAHLHPSAQLLIIEAFLMLIDKGVKLVITTHSNFMFSKICNVMLSKRIEARKVQALQFERSTTGKSITKVLQVDDYGIEDNNFSRVTDELIDERIENIR